MKYFTLTFLILLGCFQLLAQCSIDLGQDTVYFCDGGCVPLDAGAGWSSVLWSTGEGSESICVEETDTYKVVVEDSNGCVATDSVLVVQLNTSISASSLVICPDEEVELSANLTSDFISAGVVMDTTYLPDGFGVNYETTFSVQSFAQGEVFEGVSSGQYLEICAALEHSYLGDLEMMLTCPNGSNVVVFNSYGSAGIGPEFSGGFGGGGTFLGDPVDNTSTQIGIPWDYCFSDLANWGTMADEHPQRTISTTIEGGQSMSPGTYLPEQAFENLSGCPMNGDWTITIRDNVPADNGFISFWGIGFANQIGEADYLWSNGTDSSYVVVDPPSEVMWVDATAESTTCRDSIEFEFNTLPEISLGFDHADCNESNGEIINQTNPADSILIEVLTEFGLSVPPEFLDPGLYDVTITSPQGCSVDTTVQITTQIDSAELITGATVVFPGQQFTYSVPYSACLSYSWSIDNGTIVSGQGTNVVQVIWNDSISGWISVNMNETRDFGQSLILYVGTATGIANTDFESGLLSFSNHVLRVLDKNQSQLWIISTDGQLVNNQTIRGEAMVDCSTLSPGMYVAVLTTEKNQSSLKFVVSD
mgnify:CR=1 FL=1